MIMKNLIKSCFAVLLSIVAMSALLFACEKEDVSTENSDENSEFLKLPEKFNLGNPSMNDLRILSIGFERLPIDDFGNVDFSKTSAEKLKMSQDLFDIFVCSFAIDYKDTPRTRYKVEGEFSGNDCVPRAISWCIDRYRPGSSYHDIQMFCLRNYGINGVPVDKLTDVLDKFAVYRKINYTDLKYGDVITFKVSKAIGHTAIFVGRNGNTISYMTPNGEGTVPQTTNLDDLRDCIRITDAKNF